MRPRPEIVHSLTVKQPGPKEEENIYVTLGIDQNMALLEVFITRGKAGTDESADAQWIGRIISAALQIMDVEKVQPFLQALIKTSMGIQGSGVRFTGNGEKILSAPDAVAKVLAKYYKNNYGQSYLDPTKTKGESNGFNEADTNQNP